MLRNIGAPEIIVIAVLLVLVLGWKRLPDAARSLGRSMRIFKSEVSEMKQDGKSAASGDTVRGETVHDTSQERPRETPGQATTSQSTPPATDASREGDAMREDHSPRTDNHSGPVA
jgi:sec-independent protein translocase protein TatA